MKKIFSVYVIAYIGLLAVVLGLLYEYPKVELHLMLNSYHTPIEDTFFKYYSMLAEWPLYILALTPLLWKKKEFTIFYAICEVSGGVVVQLLKHLFQAPRPIMVFENHPDLVLPLVDGVSLHHSNSFPSGHTSTFFIFFTCCTVILAHYYYQKAKENSSHTWIVYGLSALLLLALATLGGYSRIYLSQHFLSDVCVGSIIGFTIPFLVFYFGRNKILKF
ncbi:MAG: phosphatase PAP2 family protein [Prevotella sp.]|nr:phosphatase PAP2 family protein [Prevotella sp.]